MLLIFALNAFHSVTLQRSLLRMSLNTESNKHQTVLTKDVLSDIARNSQYWAVDMITSNVH